MLPVMLWEDLQIMTLADKEKPVCVTWSPFHTERRLTRPGAACTLIFCVRCYHHNSPATSQLLHSSALALPSLEPRTLSNMLSHISDMLMTNKTAVCTSAECNSISYVKTPLRCLLFYVAAHSSPTKSGLW